MLLVKEFDVSFTNTHTRKILKYLKSVTGSLPEKSSTISLEEYTKEVRNLRESTSSCPYIVTSTTVKTEVTDPELRELGWCRFNFPWYTGYSTKTYHRGLDLIIHEDPKNFRPHCLRPILSSTLRPICTIRIL